MLLRTPCTLRIARTRANRLQWRRVPLRCYSSPSSDDPSWFQQLRAELLQRDVTHIAEHITQVPEKKLAQTLAGFLPPDMCRPVTKRYPYVPFGHHLIWFNPAVRTSELLPDGTDASQSPGEPWVRRMWAGGSIQLKADDYFDASRGYTLDTVMEGTEHIKHVRLHGEGDTAKIFVTIERRFARLDTLENTLKATIGSLRNRGAASKIRRHFAQQVRSDEGWGDAILKEERNLVFFKERTAAELDAVKAGQTATIKYLDPPGQPDFSQTLTPNRALLFRFSALTFNAHLIHLDPDYARNVEGHRNLLVHGPLSLLLMLNTINHYVRKKTGGKQVLESIEYRNLAPLYCDEEMRICGLEKKESHNGSTYDVWIEGPTGGVAVKGTIYTTVKNTAHAQASTVSAPIIGPSFRKLNIQNLPRRTVKANTKRSKTAQKPEDSTQDRVASEDKQSSQHSPTLPASAESTTSSEPSTSLEPTSSPRTSASSETSTTSEPPSQPQGEISNQSAPSETTSQPPSREVTSTLARDTGRAYRRDRATNTKAYNFITLPPGESPSARLVDSYKPVEPTLSVRSRELLRRARRRAPPKISIKPVPLIRTFGAKPYTPDPDRTASRHSRFLRRGVRKIEKLDIRYLNGRVSFRYTGE